MTILLIKINQRRQDIDEDPKLCMIGTENPKNCRHFDMCEKCKNDMAPKKCPRCQKAFAKTVKVQNNQ